MPNENNEIHEVESGIQRIDITVHDIDKRLSIVESGIQRQEGMRKILWGMLGFLVVQFTGAAVGYGKLQSQLHDITSFRQDTSTVLTVLGDHGTEMQSIRQEMHHIRGRDDSISDRLTILDQQLLDRTKDRWYRSDALRQADELKEWVLLQSKANAK